MTVETYTIGNQRISLSAPQLIDSFHRVLRKEKPNKPSIINSPTAEIELPYTFESSAYSTATDELYNSVQFQVAKDETFSKLQFDLIRDYENHYGKPLGNEISVDIHKGVDIFKQTLTKTDIINGQHYIRVRHRDRNLEWSDWSESIPFTTSGGLDGLPSITTSKKNYETGENIDILFESLPNEKNQWIGIFKEKSKYPGNPSEEWSYVEAVSGNKSIPFTKADGVHYAVAFRDGAYDELARTELFYIGRVPVLSTEKLVFKPKEAIKVSFSNEPNLAEDWIAIYKEGEATDPNSGGVKSTLWTYIVNANGIQEHTFEGLPVGDYFVTYLMQGLYYEPAERIYIQVIDNTTSLISDELLEKLAVFMDWHNNLLHISMPSSTTQERVDVYNISGVLVRKGYFTDNAQIDMSDQPSGIYIVRVGTQTRKIVIK